MNVADLISKYKPTEAEFDVRLDAETIFKFKVIQSYDDLKDLKEDAAKFVRVLQGDKCPPALKKFKHLSPATVSMAFFAKACCKAPEWSNADWLRLAAEAAWVFETIIEDMNRGQTKLQHESEIAEAERLGESLSATPGDEKS